MIIVAGTLQFAADQSEAVMPHILSVSELTRQESGCICYGFAQDLETAGLFHIYEEWESEEQLNAHLKAEHLVTFQEALSRFTILDQNVKVIDAAVLRKL